MLSASTLRAAKAPTRRHLAQTSAEIAGALASTISHTHYLKTELDRLVARLDEQAKADALALASATAILRRPFLGRLRWLVTGQ